MSDPRRMIILVDGYTETITAKTAVCVIRYRPEEVVAVLDRGGAGKTSGELLGVGGSIPAVAALADAPAANTLLLGIAPPGGKIPANWRPIVLEAIARRNDRGFRAARVSLRRRGIRRGRRPAWRKAGRSPPQRRARRGPAHGHPRGMPAHPYRGQRLQLRQDGRRGRSRPGAESRGRRCRVRRHRADGHARGRRRLRSRSRDLRLRGGRGGKAHPGQPASRGHSPGRAGESFSSPLFGRHA